MRECLILAGGLGTRLRSVVNDRPKCMAKIHDQTFLDFLLLFLIKNKVNKFVFSLGYQSEQIVSHLHNHYLNKIDFETIIEEEQLGTGGAISFAIGNCISDNVLILNGDTFFNFDLDYLFSFHESMRASCSIALTEMKNFDRYGSIVLNDNKQVIEFEEKRYIVEGNINTGFILLNKNYFLEKKMPYKFSLENDYLKNEIKQGNTFGLVLSGDFIDIGVPEDYEKSSLFFSNLNLI